MTVTDEDDDGCALCGSTWGDYDREIAGTWFHF